MRFLTTTQVARLYFGGARSITNRRLRRLTRAGYVRAFSRGLTTDLVFGLLPPGQDALGEFVRADTESSCPRRLDGQIDHRLAINTVRIVLATTLIAGSLDDWESDWELRRYASADTVPDARFKITWPEIGERSFALEVEYHTRSPRKFLGKMLRYGAVQTGPFAGNNPTILVVGHHPVWLERYRHACIVLSGPYAVWFTTLADLEQNGADAPIWRPHWADQPTSLAALASRPNGEGSCHPENTVTARLLRTDEAQTYSSAAIELATHDPNE